MKGTLVLNESCKRLKSLISRNLRLKLCEAQHPGGKKQAGAIRDGIARASDWLSQLNKLMQSRYAKKSKQAKEAQQTVKVTEDLRQSLLFGNLKAILLVTGYIRRVADLGKDSIDGGSHDLKLVGSTLGRRLLSRSCPCIRSALLANKVAAKLATFNHIVVFELKRSLQLLARLKTSEIQQKLSEDRVKDLLSLIFQLVHRLTRIVTRATSGIQQPLTLRRRRALPRLYMNDSLTAVKEKESALSVLAVASNDKRYSYYAKRLLARVDLANGPELQTIIGLDDHSRQIAESLYRATVYNSFAVPVRKCALSLLF